MVRGRKSNGEIESRWGCGLDEKAFCEIFSTVYDVGSVCDRGAHARVKVQDCAALFQYLHGN